MLKYLIARGYRMLPINPGLAGKPLLGAMAYASLAEAPGPIDMVEIFRGSEYAGAIVDEALKLDPAAARDLDAARRARTPPRRSARGRAASRW